MSKTTASPSSLARPGVSSRPTCRENEYIDPASCSLLPGHQHPVSDVEHLLASIRANGQLNPGQVAELPSVAGAPPQRYIVAGRRRWLAAQQGGFLYRADVYEVPDLDQAATAAFLGQVRVTENVRVNPGALDLARSLAELENKHPSWTLPELAAAVGMSPSRVSRHRAILGSSPHLLDIAEQKRFSIELHHALWKFERDISLAKARRVIARAAAGELRAADVRRLLEREKGNGQQPRRATPAKAPTRRGSAALPSPKKLQALLADEAYLTKHRDALLALAGALQDRLGETAEPSA